MIIITIVMMNIKITIATTGIIISNILIPRTSSLQLSSSQIARTHTHTHFLEGVQHNVLLIVYMQHLVIVLFDRWYCWVFDYGIYVYTECWLGVWDHVTTWLANERECHAVLDTRELGDHILFGGRPCDLSWDGPETWGPENGAPRSHISGLIF